MGNGYYYTLSAIAQSFAAIIALNTVFVVFRLQLVQNTFESLFSEVRKLIVRDKTGGINDTPSIMLMTREVDTWTKKELCGWLVKGKIESNRLSQPRIEAKRNALNKEMKKIHRHRHDIMNWLYVTLILNSITILISLILLPLGNIRCGIFQHIVISVVLVFGAFTLCSTINAIIITIGGGKGTFVSDILVFLLRLFGSGEFASKLEKTKLPK
jgi:hypothetical protein